MARPSRSAFTLVELLVVIGIIALLIAILMPALNSARAQAKSVTSLSNLRQLGIGLVQYRVENKGYYPLAAWNKLADRARTRWADAIYPYMKNAEVYMSPQLDEPERARMNKPFFHTTTGTASDGSEIIVGKTLYFGGYGYNWHYLGNGRTTSGAPEFFAKEGVQIRATSKTIAIADTNGSKNGTGQWTSEGVYVIDPPLMSQTMGSRGSRKTSTPAPGLMPGPGNYGYTGGNDGDPLHRSTPAERNRGMVNVLFCDGHAVPLKLSELDDSDGDGTRDNGYWNGKANSGLR